MKTTEGSEGSEKMHALYTRAAGGGLLLALTVVFTVAPAASGCGSDPAPGGGTGGDGGGSGGNDGGGGEGGVVVPAGCDLTKDPAVSAACVDEAVGVFVSSKGDDGGAGTKASPYKTLGKGVEKLGSKVRVYVCEGTYAESVEVKRALSVYGGFSCADWKAGTAKVRVEAPAGSSALRVAGATGEVVVADVELVSKDAAAGTGDSSIAVLATDSASLVLRRVTVEAGAGADAPLAGAAVTNLFSGSLTGEAASGTTGGAGKTCACKTHGLSVGGKGGDGKNPVADGGTSGAASPAVTMMVGRDSTGGALGEVGGSLCSGGRSGSDGAARKGGGAGASGTLGANGYTAGAGGAGEAGNPGAGGGGGGGGLTDGGGGGGCGACGGGAGLGGKGGGASVGVAAVKTAVRLEACKVQTKKAGSGAKGGTGEAGGGGGGGGTVGACSGGRGGNGAGGGGGGGGAGGVSVGVLHSGPAPQVDGLTQVTLGDKGAAGPGGDGGAGGTNVLSTAPAGDPGVAGADGASAPTLSL